MDRTMLIRAANYGAYREVSSRAAIEPPHWMLCKVEYMVRLGRRVTMCDFAVEPLPYRPLSFDKVEIWPTGNHPSAFIQEQENVQAVIDMFPTKKVSVATQLDFNPIAVAPRWGFADIALYRTHNWHAWGYPSRQRYGTVHTSVGCPMKCRFCTVNNYYGGKYAPREWIDVLIDLDILARRNVKHIKVMDELFFTKTPRFERLIREMASAKMGLNLWAYARVDTVDFDLIKFLRPAGVNWVCLGIESGEKSIREAAGKGSFTNVDVKAVVRALHDEGVHVMGNYMIGFPEDNISSLRSTLDFAMELQTDYANFYAMVAYPGTPMEEFARSQGWELPTHPSQYNQYSRDFLPLPTHHLSPADVLAFRELAWHEYHSLPSYRGMILDKFGEAAAVDVDNMVSTVLTYDALGGGDYTQHRIRR